MNCIIPFEKRIEFDKPVKEICSISLEHEITKNDTELLGNFILSGTYKEHELSINTNDFKFTIPFSVELTSRIDNDTLDFKIDNFTYDLENNGLDIKIDYIIDAEDIREEPDFIEVPDIEEPEVLKDEVKSEDRDLKESILQKNEFTNDYFTYHIHLVKENESLDSIALKYNVTKDDLTNINNILEINPNDKILVPINNE